MKTKKDRHINEDSEEHNEEHSDPVDLIAENQNAFFETEPVAPNSRFRSWARRHKRPVYGVLLLALIAGLFAWPTQTRPVSVQGVAQAYFARFESDSESWAYRIGKSRVSKQHLAQQFPHLAAFTLGPGVIPQAQRISAGQSSAYQDYVRKQLETDLMVQAAIKSRLLESPEARFVLENGLRKLIADYYVHARLRGRVNHYQPQITSSEVDQFYKKHKNRFQKRGVEALAARRSIALMLSGARRRKLAATIQQARSGILAELRDTSGYQLRIEQRSTSKRK